MHPDVAQSFRTHTPLGIDGSDVIFLRLHRISPASCSTAVLAYTHDAAERAYPVAALPGDNGR
jgi:hypothetical protein